MGLTIRDYRSIGCDVSYEELRIYDENEINECPMCNKSIKTTPLVFAGGKGKVQSTGGKDEVDSLGIICKCPNCKELIYATYLDLGNMSDDYTYSFNWQLKSIYPMNNYRTKFEDSINIISPKFENIYNQSTQAEHMGLNEICGMGYRKALEFLVKDYAKQENPGKEDDIERKMLGKCISEYIDMEEIKRCARGASYIGNDESHYIRVWENKDLRDLKKLINLTVLWINLQETTKEYTREMNL